MPAWVFGDNQSGTPLGPTATALAATGGSGTPVLGGSATARDVVDVGLSGRGTPDAVTPARAAALGVDGAAPGVNAALVVVVAAESKPAA